MAQPEITHKTGFFDLPRELRDKVYSKILYNIAQDEAGPEVRNFDIQSPVFENVSSAHSVLATELRERDLTTRTYIKFHLGPRTVPWIPPPAAYKCLEQVEICFNTYQVNLDWKYEVDRSPWEISRVAKHVAGIVKWINTYSSVPNSKLGSASSCRWLWVEFQDGGHGDLSFYDQLRYQDWCWYWHHGRRLARMETNISWSPLIVERLLEPLRRIQPATFQAAGIREISDVMSDGQMRDCGFIDEGYDSFWMREYFYELQSWICGHQRDREKEKMEWLERLEREW